MADFSAGQWFTATALNNARGELKSDTQNTLGSTTSTSFTPTLTGGTTCGLSFTTPTSGKVLIFNTCQVNAAAGAYAACSFEVRTGATIGSGTIVVGSTFDTAIEAKASTENRMTATQTLVLTPLTVYNIQQHFVTQSGTSNFLRKHLVVLPTS